MRACAGRKQPAARISVHTSIVVTPICLPWYRLHVRRAQASASREQFMRMQIHRGFSCFSLFIARGHTRVTTRVIAIDDMSGCYDILPNWIFFYLLRRTTRAAPFVE